MEERISLWRLEPTVYTFLLEVFTPRTFEPGFHGGF